VNPFKKDRNHLLKYFTLNTILFFALNILLLKTRSYDFHIHFNLISFVSIVSGLILGLVSATAFHNASHGNIKPRFLNALIGELTADFSLEDIRCFRVGHMLHHMHVDDPELDPHPPRGLTFFGFIASSRQKTIQCIANFYYKHHGKTKASERNVAAQIVVFHIKALLKLCFWFLLFGPTGFLFFYIPAYLSYFFGFAHLNYVSHQDEEGVAEIHNHNENTFYKMMNVLTSGGYYHKNHHLSPGLYNPSRLNQSGKREERLSKARYPQSASALSL
jgi:stearoyl-CoA desaturase (delta-9 desaturase)